MLDYSGAAGGGGAATLHSQSKSEVIENSINELQEIFEKFNKDHHQEVENHLLERLLEIRSLDLNTTEVDRLIELFNKVLYPCISKRLESFSKIIRIYNSIKRNKSIDDDELDQLRTEFTNLVSTGATSSTSGMKFIKEISTQSLGFEEYLKIIRGFIDSLKSEPEYLGTAYCIAKSIQDSRTEDTSTGILPGIQKIKDVVSSYFAMPQTTSTLGEGHFGTVKKVGEEFVIKIFKRPLPLLELDYRLKLVFEKIPKVHRVSCIAYPLTACYHLLDQKAGLILPKIIGETALDILNNQRKPFPAKELLEIGHNLARAVQLLHERDIVHCDIKPNNFMINRTREVFIIDIDDCCKRGQLCKSLTVGYSLSDFDKPADFDQDYFSLGASLFKLYTGISLKTFLNLPTDASHLSFKEKLIEKTKEILDYLENGKFLSDSKTSEDNHLVKIIVSLTSTDIIEMKKAFEELKDLELA